MNTPAVLFLALVSLLACAGPRTAPHARQAPDQPVRAVWVTRWDYRSPDDVARIIDRLADLGATDVLWQVRGQADAFYRSRLEPWGEELLADNRSDPGFDPLTLAVRRAHARGLRLHAWVNVFPLWKGTTPPRNPSHLLHTHPHWRLRDQHDSPQPLNDHYVILNPVLPAVHDHIVAVLKDLTTRYDIDGIHLDYIRFVSETHEQGRLYPGDPATLDLYRAAGGAVVAGSPKDPAHFRAWVRDRISDLVARIRTEVVGPRRDLTLSAAVWRRPDIARDTYLQDATRWLDQRLLDLAMPMIYTDSDDDFLRDLAAWRAAAPRARLVPGVGTYKHDDPQRTIAQARASPDAFALFAYAALFESADPNQPRDPASVALRAARRKAVADARLFP